MEKAGAKGYHLKGEGEITPDGPMWEPDFDDPIFLDKLDHFLAAAAARYDGNPHVAFIDVGSFGVWGEGHTVASTRIPYSVATIRRHIDLYRKNFKRTLLVANDDFMIQGRGIEALGYARDQGLSLRDDSILVEPGAHAYYHAFLAYNFWPRLPVILEPQHYGESKQRRSLGRWAPAAPGGRGLPRELPYGALVSAGVSGGQPRSGEPDQPAPGLPAATGGGLLAGRGDGGRAPWPSATAGAMRAWRPCLPGGHPTITFKDEKGGIAGVFVDEGFNVRELPVGPPGEATVLSRKELGTGVEENDQPLVTYTLPPAHILKPGTYDLYISVGTATGEPVIALPLAGDDGHRRYRLGGIKVTGKVR